MSLARMLANTAYGQLLSKIKSLFDSHQIDTHYCDAFEETILKLMDIDDKPKGCRFSRNGFDHCILVLTIPTSSGDELVKNLNKSYPSLEAKNITSSAETFDISTDINGNSAVVIQMNAKAVENYLLPELAKYFQTHPEDISYYQSFSYSITEIETTLKQIFKDEWSLPIDSEDLVDILWKMLILDAPKAKLIQDELIKLSLSLVGIICDYLTFQVYLPTEISRETQIQNSSLQRNFQHPIFTDLNFTFKGPASAAPQKAIARYLNGFMPGSATIIDIDTPDTKSAVKGGIVRLQNKAWMNPALLFSIKEALKNHAEEKKDLPTQETKASTVTTCGDEILMLRKIKQFLTVEKDYQEMKSTSELTTALQSYIDYIEQAEFTDYFSRELTLVGLIKLAIENLSKELSPDFKKREKFAEIYFNKPASSEEIIKAIKNELSKIFKTISESLKEAPKSLRLS